MVELRGASKSYGPMVALHPTDLAFEEGKVTALIGPSGCGKSTLLRLLLGLISPSSGQAVFDGAVVSEANLIEIRRRTGYVIQDGGLFPHLTAKQNVTLVASLELRGAFDQKVSEANNRANRAKAPIAIDEPLTSYEARTHAALAKGTEDGLKAMLEMADEFGNLKDRLYQLADLVRIPKELLERYPAELSGGQRQRISLMRALMLSPKVLLLDEPLAALDPMVRSALQTDLKRIFEELGTTVILVTHDMGEAAYLGETIVLLREGKIVQIGKLEDFQKTPKEPFVTEFLNAQRSLVAL